MPETKPEQMDELHAAIMNLPCKPRDGLYGAPGCTSAYREGHRDARHAAAELVAAHLRTRAAGEVPRGWQIVPIEPTEEMARRAWDDAIAFAPGTETHRMAGGYSGKFSPEAIYRAMLAAAPLAGPSEQTTVDDAVADAMIDANLNPKFCIEYAGTLQKFGRAVWARARSMAAAPAQTECAHLHCTWAGPGTPLVCDHCGAEVGDKINESIAGLASPPPHPAAAQMESDPKTNGGKASSNDQGDRR